MSRNLIRKHLLQLSQIPRDLDAVTQIDAPSEVDPQNVGMTAADVTAIWDCVRRLYRTGTHPAITLSVRRQGKVLLSRGIGHARGNGPRDDADAVKVPVTADTPFCVYSSSKGVTALLMHMLAEDGLINIMDPVAFYTPEFARKGKENITIHQILAHRGGIPGLPANVDPNVLWDEEATWELLCNAEPIITDGSRLAYHAITGGFVLGRVVREVTGDDLNTYIDRKLRQPMGLKYFTYGIAREHLDDLAVSYVTGPPHGPLLKRFVKRALGTDMRRLESLVNDPRYQAVTIPAGNLAASANECTAFFQMMLDGGRWQRRRICREETIARCVQEFGKRSLDRTLMLPMRYSAGLMLGDRPFGVWGPDSYHAFGHLGLINKFNWADPERELSVSLLTSGLPLIAPHVLPLLNILRTINERSPKVRSIKSFALHNATNGGRRGNTPH